MPATVDVSCPPGVLEGDEITITVGVSTFTVVLPPGVLEGDTFSVELPDAVQFANFNEDLEELPVLVGVVAQLEARGAATDDHSVLDAALNIVIDAIEDHDNADLDALVDGNAERFAGFPCEAELEWTGLHERYVELLEDHIGQVLASLECSAEEVFRYAHAYAGADERSRSLVLRLLAMADFDDFCKMMRQRHEILEVFG